MKGKLLVCGLLAFIPFSFSCKKQALFDIAGDWISVAAYTQLQDGTYGWIPTNRWPEFYHFEADGRFSTSSDVPGGKGTYNYNKNLQQLTLNYEEDRYGNTAHTAVHTLQMLAGERIVITYHSSISGIDPKMEFVKYD